MNHQAIFLRKKEEEGKGRDGGERGRKADKIELIICVD